MREERCRELSREEMSTPELRGTNDRPDFKSMGQGHSLLDTGWFFLERAMGFEPTTTCLGSKDSTTELRPPREDFQHIT
jgi:hypothetical protein